jgi:multicomponent K+:H+ antiporter subunit G
MDTSQIVEIIVAALIVFGAVFAAIGSFGLFKLPDFYMRLHGPTKATTLGVGSMLIGSVVFFTFGQGTVTLHEVLITLFLFMTAPVSAHILSKAALQAGLDDQTGMVRQKTTDVATVEPAE